MSRILIAVLAATLLCESLLAQSPQAPVNESTPGSTSPAVPPNSPHIAPGSVIPVELTKSIDAKKAKAGDEIVARVTQDLRNDTGTVIVAKDTKVVGHVTSVQARNKEQKESELTIAFDRAILKNGGPMQLPMSIQAIIASPNRNADNASPGAPPGGSSPATASRQGQMEGPVPATSIPPSAASAPTDAAAGTQAQPRITLNTQGVVGVANLKLAAAPDATQGSVLSSEKNNVRLDEGTFLLLRVSQ
jgi:hypothetical protein